MEFGAFFILVIFLAVVGVLGGFVYAIASKRRRAELSAGATEQASEGRPAHHEVESEQNADFVGTP